MTISPALNQLIDNGVPLPSNFKINTIFIIIVLGLILGLTLGLVFGLKKDITYTYVGDKKYKNFMNIENIEGNMYEKSPEFKQAVDKLYSGDDEINTEDIYKDMKGQPNFYLVGELPSEKGAKEIVSLSWEFVQEKVFFEISPDTVYFTYNYKNTNGEWVNPNFILEKEIVQNYRDSINTKIQELKDSNIIFYNISASLDDNEENFKESIISINKFPHKENNSTFYGMGYRN